MSFLAFLPILGCAQNTVLKCLEFLKKEDIIGRKIGFGNQTHINA